MARITVQEIRLTGVNVDLQPSKDWRDLARLGRRSMQYKIFGRARLENGEEIGIDARVAALDDSREIADLGDGSLPVVASLLAKNESLNSMKLRYRADGMPETDADGRPVYAEGPVMQDDGKEFPSEYGTHWFCTLHPNLRFTLTGVTLDPAGREVPRVAGSPEKIPVYKAEIQGYRVEKVAAAAGAKLFGSVKIGVTGGSAEKQHARAQGTAAEAAALVM